MVAVEVTVVAVSLCSESGRGTLSPEHEAMRRTERAETKIDIIDLPPPFVYVGVVTDGL